MPCYVSEITRGESVCPITRALASQLGRHLPVPFCILLRAAMRWRRSARPLRGPLGTTEPVFSRSWFRGNARKEVVTVLRFVFFGGTIPSDEAYSHSWAQ